MSQAEVLIVGAGPVGLSLAGFLTASGISCLVLEAREAPDTALRASTFHPPTLDMLDELGVADRLIRSGLITPTWQMRQHATGRFVRFDLSAIAAHTRHPFRLQCEQHVLCELLVEQLAQSDHCEVLFGHRACDLAQDESGVRLTCESEGQAQVLAGRWLVGADGAGSMVRNQLGLGFDGETYPQASVLATTSFPLHEHLTDLDNVNYCWGKDAPFSLLRLQNRWRASLYPRPGDDLEDVLEARRLDQYLSEIFAGETMPVEDARAYRVHQRVATRYRVERVFLAGDAAHLNVPSGGMGMNGGIHDAHNLAQRMTAVHRGSNPGLLDGYEHQRRWLAQEAILPLAADNRARMAVADAEGQEAKLRYYADLTQDRDRLTEYLLKSSMITSLQQAAARE